MTLAEFVNKGFAQIADLSVTRNLIADIFLEELLEDVSLSIARLFLDGLPTPFVTQFNRLLCNYSKHY